MMNDVLFNNISAMNDWNIVLTKTDITPPKVKTSIVNIKGADGILDLSEALNGDVIYDNRDIKLTFSLMDMREYSTLISKISNAIHGKKVKLRFTIDDEYYYEGRAQISQWESSKNIGKIVVNVNADPFKYRLYETSVTVALFGTEQVVHLQNDRMRVSPTLTALGKITITYDKTIRTLKEGEQQFADFSLKEGDNVIKLNGNGTVTISYRRGML